MVVMAILVLFVVHSAISATATMFRSNRGHLFQHGGIVLRVDHAHILGRIVCHIAVAVPRMHVAQLVRAAPGVARRQDALEGLPKLRIEYRIDDGIERRIGVAQPGEDLERLAADAGLAERRHDVHAEEGHPADQEHAHDDAHRDGGLVVGDVVRRGVHLLQLELRLVRLRPPDAPIVLLLGYFAGPRHRPDRLDVLLGVAV